MLDRTHLWSAQVSAGWSIQCTAWPEAEVRPEPTVTWLGAGRGSASYAGGLQQLAAPAGAKLQEKAGAVKAARRQGTLRSSCAKPG